MDSVIKIINQAIGGLSSIFVGLLGLGVLVSLVFGQSFFLGDVVGNLLGLDNGLGEQGLVGLIVAIILISLFSKD